MTAEQFHDRLSQLLTEAGQSKIPLGMMVATLEMLKIEIVTDQINFNKRQAFIQAQAAANGPLIKPVSN